MHHSAQVSAPRNRRGSRWVRRVALAAVAVVVGLVAVRSASDALVTSRDRAVARDSETGLLLGAHPKTLGPEDAHTAVLLVHGFVGAGNNFGELAERLAADGHRVRVMLLPGHGTSPREFERVEPETLEDAVNAERAALEARHERVVLVGHSMGGTLATLVASRANVDGLVLAAPYFGVTARWYYGLDPETWIEVASSLLRWIYKGELFLQVNRPEAKPNITSYAWVPLQGLRTLSELGRRGSSRAVLARIDAPVLLLHSEGDVAASLDASRVALEGMPSARKRAVWLRDSNHHLFWDHDREQVLREIQAFVSEVDSRPIGHSPPLQPD